MKAIEIFMIKKSFTMKSSQVIRQKAENVVNEKYHQRYRVITVDFNVADNAGYIYTFIAMKRPNTYNI